MPAAPSSSRQVVILGASRTPIGKFGGAFKDVHAAELGAVAATAAMQRAGIAAADIEEVLMGHGRPAGVGPNPARQVGHRAGVPNAAPAYTINKACAAQVLAVLKDLAIPAEKLNVNGGAIALGHPIGCSGGMGMAMAIEIL